jgi:hypothetical protein
MTSTRFGFGTLLIATALTIATLSGAKAYTAEQEQLCTNDAFRLCSSEIPDVDRVTACMLRNKPALSAGCKSVFGASTPASSQPASAKASKPINLTPQKPRRAGA